MKLTPWSVGLFGAVCAVVGGVIAWGRVRPVEIPVVGHWAAVPVVCAGRGVSVAEFRRAVSWWSEQDHPLSLSCEHPTVTVEVDPHIDTRDSVEDVGTTHGLTQLQRDGDTILRASVRVIPGSDAIVYAHELGHALGFGHPRFAPTGHVMHPSRPGWDCRGCSAGGPP